MNERATARERYKRYNEGPYKRDHLDDQNAYGTTHGFSPSMHVGGLAMHWGAVTPRYSRYWFEKAGDEELELLQVVASEKGGRSQKACQQHCHRRRGDRWWALRLGTFGPLSDAD